MGRGLSRTLLLMPALLTAAVFALPVWDHWYYSPTRLGSSSGIAATPAYATGRDNRPGAPEPGAASPQPPVMVAGLSPAPAVAVPAGEVKAGAPAPPARSLDLQRASSTAASTVANGARAVSHTEGAPPASGSTQPSPWTQPPPAPAPREIGVAQAVGSFPYPIAVAAAPARPPSQAGPTAPAVSSAPQQPAVVRAPMTDDPPPDAPVQPSRVSLVPNRTTLAPGDSLIVQVQANAAQPVSSVPFHLDFDPSVL